MYVSCSVVSSSLWPQELGTSRTLCPWNSPGKNTGVGDHSLLEGESSWPRDQTWVSGIAGRFFTIWREAPCPPGAKSLHSCPTLCNPMDYSPHKLLCNRILQIKILEWLPCPSPGDLPDPGIKSASLTSPALAGRFFCVVFFLPLAPPGTLLAFHEGNVKLPSGSFQINRVQAEKPLKKNPKTILHHTLKISEYCKFSL